MLKTQKRIKKILLVPVFAVLISFAAPLFPVFTPSANALTGDDIVAQTQAWQLLSGIAFASGNHFRDTLTTQQADACDFIKPGDAVYSDGAKISGEDSYAISVGYAVSSGDGLWNSGNPPTSGIQSGLKYIGIANCTDFAKQLGYTISGASYKIPNNQQVIKDKANELGQKLARTLNVAWGTAPNYMDYWALFNAFTLGCQAQYRQIYTEDDSISSGHSTDEINRNLEAQKNGDTANSGQGHYYINVYLDAAVKRHVYYVGSDNFATANVGYGLNKNEQAGVMGCTRDNQTGGLGVIRWWLAQHPEFAGEYQNKVQTDDPTAGSDAAQHGVTTPPDTKSSCNVEGVGWIICPVVRLIANVTDAAYGFVTSLLTVQPLLTTGKSAAIYKAWSLMRNIANVAFVIAFLLIIYSQLTSMGISNYGIKKMLPRIIIAAILVNLSYWICSIAVDLSNIFGMSVNGLFKAAGANISTPSSMNEIDQAFVTGSGWVGITGLVLAGVVVTGVVFYMTLSALLPALIVAFAAVVTVFLVLTLRQALIILLIVVSPLAFVAFLLPNTEGLFKKWRELFQTLLLMFPIIAGIFGASSLASQVIMQSASGPYAIIIQIMGALASVIPLALTPVVMKSAGGLLNRFGGVINNPNKGPFDRMRKGAESYNNSRKEYRKLKALNGFRTLPGVGVATRIGARRRAVLANRQRELKSSEAGLVADTAINNASYARKLANGGGDGALQRAVDSAVSIKASIQAEEVKAANARIDRTVLGQDALRSVALGNGGEGRFGKIDSGDKSAQHAAIQQTVAAQDAIGIAQLLANSHTFDAESQKVLADSLMTSRPGFVSFGTIAQVRQGDKSKPINVSQLVDTAVNNGTYSAQKLASIDKDEAAMVADSLQRARTDMADIAAARQVQADATTALSDPKLGAGKNRENLTNIANGNPGKY